MKTKEKTNRVAEHLNGTKAEPLTISPPNFKRASFRIIGDAPLVINAFSQKARQMMRETQEAGHTAKKGKKREPKDFMGNYEAAKHVHPDGWCGYPAAGFRNALISSCRMAGYAMTRAKLSLFVEADGFEADGTPLVRITKGEPHYHESYVRNATGVVDLRARAMWDPGWEMTVRVKWDADQFTLQDVANLLLRAGMQVGIGEGRPDSKGSAGCGWGTYTLAEGE